MNLAMDHVLMAPILVPLLIGSLMLLTSDRYYRLRATLGLLSVLAQLLIAVQLLGLTDQGSLSGAYLLANWSAPFGIVLVADRLSALMLTLTAILALSSMLFSLARWQRAGMHFHPLVQYLLMGVNGAFLTGDLFNLFVFFEVLLAASYGLALHGAGTARIRAGLHYIVINLGASLLFLIGVAMIYGVTGTLNMADLSLKVAHLEAAERSLLHAGATILAVAFLAKAALWPLGFWLPTTYAAAAAPVAALFAILSKVGVYSVLRVWMLLFGVEAGASAQFGAEWLLGAGLFTVAYAAIGCMASQDLSRLAGYFVMISSGTLLAAIGTGQVGVIAGALFYMLGSTLGIAAFYLLVELTERGRVAGADILAVTLEAFGRPADGGPEEEAIGVAIPATMAILALSFMLSGLLLAGLPPMSGFLGKFAMLSAAFNPDGQGIGEVPGSAWALLTVLLLSGLAALIALVRAGIRSFWAPLGRTVPRVRVIEMTPVALLLVLAGVLTVQAGPALQYTTAAAEELFAPANYVDGVLSEQPVAKGAR